MNVTVSHPIEDQGTVVIFEGFTDDDRLVTFAVDHRLAQSLCEGIEYGDEAPRVELEGYQVLHIGAVGADV